MTSFRIPKLRLLLLLLSFHVMRNFDPTHVGGPDKFVFGIAWIVAVLIVVSFTPLNKERL